MKFAFEQERHYTMASDFVSGTAIAKIRCIVKKGKKTVAGKADKTATDA